MKVVLRAVGMALVGIVIAFGVFGGFSKKSKGATPTLLDALPKDSFLAGTVDLEGLRRSGLGNVLFGSSAATSEPLKRAIGVTGLTEACGFDPIARLKGFGVAIPQADTPDNGEFGVAFEVDLSGAELERCAKATVAQKGGAASTHKQGRFAVLETPSSTGARFAYGEGGLLVVSQGTWFEAMLSAANRTAPSLRDATLHTALRSSLAAHGHARPLVMVTAVLPPSMRERMRSEFREETAGNDAANVAMNGVLGVEAVGIAVSAVDVQKEVHASAELTCEDDKSCAAVTAFIEKKRRDFKSNLTLRVLQLGPILDAIEVQTEHTHLRISVVVSNEKVHSAIETATHFWRTSPRPPAP
jgi:hypothetical protein